MDFDELDDLDPVEVPDEAVRDLALVILGATGAAFWGTGAPTGSDVAPGEGQSLHPVCKLCVRCSYIILQYCSPCPFPLL